MKTTHIATAIALLAGFAAAPAFAVGSPGTAVDLELSLIVDVSGSVDASEFDLQKTGYVKAFQDASIQAAIASGHSVAANLIYWSGANQQQVAVDWFLITDASSANTFASLIDATVRPFSGNTAVGSGINFAVPLFGSNAFIGTRQVIDVSGDGAANEGANTAAARDAAALVGIQINGLPILGEPGLLSFYTDNVVTAGGFVQPAASFVDFERAVTVKVGKEIIGAIPEPSTYAMLGLGLGLVGWMGNRRKRSA